MTSKEHLGHVVADNAYLAFFAHVDIVDETPSRQPLRQLVDKSRQHTGHLILAGQFPTHNILVISIADGTE